MSIAPKRLSVCMIVKNEEALLARCLGGAREVADEIIVVDTGSSDDTIHIAREAGAQVFEQPWKDDFSRARNFSLEKATGDWILWLDADDVIPVASVSPLIALKSESPDRVFALTVRNEKPGSTGSSFVQARFFPNHPLIRFEGRIHEQMMPSALRLGMAMVHRDIVIEHHGYADPAQVAKKARRNIELLLTQCDPSRADPVMAIELADAYLMVGEWSDARKWFGICVAIQGIDTAMPDIASHGYLGLGKCCVEAKDYEEGMRWITRALALCPDRPDALYSLAVACEMTGRPKDAMLHLRRIIDIGEKPILVSVDFREAQIKSYLRLERLYREANQIGKSLDLALEARSRLPHRPEIHTMVGQALFRDKKLIESLHAFEESLKLAQGGNLDAYVGLCQVYVVAGRRQTAQQTLDSLKPHFCNHPRYWALCQVVLGGRVSLPASISDEEVTKELKLLKSVYGSSHLLP